MASKRKHRSDEPGRSAESHRLSPRDEPGQLQDHPGPHRSSDTDAVGEGDVEQLAQETEGRVFHQREMQLERDRVRPMHREPPPDNRRRMRESNDRPGAPPAPDELEPEESA